MIYVCVRDVMDVVLSVLFVRRVALSVLVYGKYECFVIQINCMIVSCVHYVIPRPT